MEHSWLKFLMGPKKKTFSWAWKKGFLLWLAFILKQPGENLQKYTWSQKGFKRMTKLNKLVKQGSMHFISFLSFFLFSFVSFFLFSFFFYFVVILSVVVLQNGTRELEGLDGCAAENSWYSIDFSCLHMHYLRPLF